MSDPESNAGKFEVLSEKLADPKRSPGLDDGDRDILLQLIKFHEQFTRSYSSSDGSGLTVETKTQISIKPPPNI